MKTRTKLYSEEYEVKMLLLVFEAGVLLGTGFTGDTL
jgi:hypothetical protein